MSTTNSKSSFFRREDDGSMPQDVSREARPERETTRENNGGERREWKPRTEGGGERREWKPRTENGGGERREWKPRTEGGGERREWKPRTENGGGERREWKPRTEGGGERREWKPRTENGGGERREWKPRTEGGGERREWKPRTEGGGERREWKPRTEGGGEHREWKPRTEGGGERREWKPRTEGGGEHREWKPRTEGGGERREWKPRTEGGGERREWKPRTEGGGERREWKPRTEGGGEHREWKPRTENGGGERREWKPRTENGGERREWKPRTENGGERREWKPRTENGGEHREWKPRTEGGGERREWKPRTENGGERREWKPRTEGGGERREWKPRTEGDGEHRESREWTPNLSEDGPRTYLTRERRQQERSTNITQPLPKVETDPNAPIRLNRYIAMSGVCSRREADVLITERQVTVNGEVVDQLGAKVTKEDKICLNGELLKGEKKVYIIMNKPKGFVTTTDDPHADKTVIDLLKGEVKERVYPVGRLDKNTTGVLLITNDGELTNELTHPSFDKGKLYHVFLNRDCTAEDVAKLKAGFDLEDGNIFADEAEFVNDQKDEIGLEIHSGRNRIVRRMFEHLGYDVVKLDRVYFAGFTKMGLRRGFWRFLTPREVAVLKGGSYK